jgi:uncharacterized surface protein with fasciclin (FAS1) repeats
MKGGEKYMKQSTILIGVIVLLVLGVGAYLVMGSQNPPQPAQSMTQEAEAEDTSMENSSEATEQTIVDVAAGNPDFETLVTAVKAAGLVETLSGDGPYTVFAPTDEAFAKLPAGTLDSLLQDKEQLTKILTYHVVPGRVLAKDVVGLPSAKTVQGQEVAITVDGGKVKINDANVISTDIQASNGVIHVIDTVILPQ